MSSAYVRTQVKAFMAANSAEKVMDLTALFGEVNKNLLANSPSISPSQDWVGLQFIGGDEGPRSLPATNDQGLYREDGALFIHVVTPAKIGAGASLLTRGETLRDIFRGRRIGSIIIQSVTPLNFDNGATLQFDGGWMSASFLCDYYRDNNL